VVGRPIHALKLDALLMDVVMSFAVERRRYFNFKTKTKKKKTPKSAFQRKFSFQDRYNFIHSLLFSQTKHCIATYLSSTELI
jgi:hypothetical protein